MEEFIVTLKLNTQKKWDATSVPLLVMNFSPEGDNVLKKATASTSDSDHQLHLVIRFSPNYPPQGFGGQLY